MIGLFIIRRGDTMKWDKDKGNRRKWGRSHQHKKNLDHINENIKISKPCRAKFGVSLFYLVLWFVNPINSSTILGDTCHEIFEVITL